MVSPQRMALQGLWEKEKDVLLLTDTLSQLVEAPDADGAHAEDQSGGLEARRREVTLR